MNAQEIAISEPRSWYRVEKPLAPGPGVFFDLGAVIPCPSEYIAPPAAAELSPVQSWADYYIKGGRIVRLSDAQAAQLGLFAGGENARHLHEAVQRNSDHGAGHADHLPPGAQGPAGEEASDLNPPKRKRGRPRKVRA